jgi:hypothetical protein
LIPSSGGTGDRRIWDSPKKFPLCCYSAAWI